MKTAARRASVCPGFSFLPCKIGLRALKRQEGPECCWFSLVTEAGDFCFNQPNYIYGEMFPVIASSRCCVLLLCTARSRRHSPLILTRSCNSEAKSLLNLGFINWSSDINEWATEPQLMFQGILEEKLLPTTCDVMIFHCCHSKDQQVLL